MKSVPNVMVVLYTTAEFSHPVEWWDYLKADFCSELIHGKRVIALGLTAKTPDRNYSLLESIKASFG